MKHSMQGVMVGDTVTVVRRNHGGRPPIVRDRAVTRVGRTYFYTDGDYSEQKFEILTGVEPVNAGPAGVAYMPEQYAESLVRADALAALLAAGVEIKRSWNTPFTTDQLTAMLVIFTS